MPSLTRAGGGGRSVGGCTMSDSCFARVTGFPFSKAGAIAMKMASIVIIRWGVSKFDSRLPMPDLP